jgi:hypothetical protein
VKPLPCHESPGTRFVPSIYLESRVPGTLFINEPRVNWMVLKGGKSKYCLYSHGGREQFLRAHCFMVKTAAY